MLNKIIEIKNVGLFHDAKWMDFKKATLIFAENGRGKSTLSNLFYCLANENNQILKTIDSNELPQISLLLNGKRINFSNNAWSESYPNIVIFDEHFINNNIYSGMKIEGTHRTNLLEFIIGEQAVSIKNGLDTLTKEIQELTSEISGLEKQLKIHHNDVSLESFINLPKTDNVEQEISNRQTKIQQARNVEKIKSFPIPIHLQNTITLDLEYIGSLLNKDIVKIEQSAEEIVLKHIKNHDHSIENWIEQGQKFIINKDCPLCGQSLDNSALIKHYNLYFNKEYEQLKNDVNQLFVKLEKLLDLSFLSRLESDTNSNDSKVIMWSTYIKSDAAFSFNHQEIESHLSKIKELLIPLIEIKKCQPLEKVDFSVIKTESQNLLDRINKSITSYNNSVDEFILSVNSYKESLEKYREQSLAGEINRLQLSELRHRNDIDDLITFRSNKQDEKRTKEELKKQEKEKLKNELSQYLNTYTEEINRLLNNFGTNFTISEFKHDYMSGGKPRIDYKITLRGNAVKLDTLSTALSAGDKRTLAFAMFIVRLNRDSERSNKIIVIDDPICSLDMGRRNSTKRILCNIAKQSEQVIILGHDAYFLRDIHDDLEKNNIEASSVKISRGNNGYSKFESANFNEKCHSEYHKKFMLLENFVKNGSGEEDKVACAIRPLLEGYLHRRFPAQVSRNTLIGVIIANANNASSDNPLYHLKNLTNELNEVNDYAGDFHHSTINDVSTDSNELLSFVKRTLKVIQKGNLP